MVIFGISMKTLRYLFLVPVVVNLTGQLLESRLLEMCSKPFLMPLLALSVFLYMKDHDVRGPRVRTIVSALIFGAIGDIFLMMGAGSAFVMGMAAFFIGHVCYFCTLPAPWKVKGISGKVLSLLLLAALIFAVVKMAGTFNLGLPLMRVAVPVYACAFAFLIHACIVAAIDRKKPLYLLTALGFAIFAFSDYFVAVGAFTQTHVPMRGFIVMSTYILAQVIVSYSLAREEVHELEDTDYGVRVKRLYALWDALKAHEDGLSKAFIKDFGKGEFETYTTEIGYLYNDLRYTVSHLRDWMERKAVPTPFVLWPGKSRILYEPYGKVLIIGPFNYPLHLVIAPLTAALSAGNTAVVKLSRQTPAVSGVIAKMLKETFAEDVVEVLGDDVSNEAMLSRRYDYIFFTGSPRVGSIVMEAAARNLTPVTLELGGKSPAIVCSSASVRLACERIAKGKFLNAGQTCVAPDYVLVHESVHDEFISVMKDVIHEYFGDISVRPAEMTLVATRRHFDRLAALIPASAEVVIGGYTDESINYISPTVIDNASWTDPAMQEEIFGPILPVISFRDLQTEVIEKVKAGEKPLSLYIFSKDRAEISSVLSQISFGGGCVNETIMHLGNENLPFGGVGNSGIGAYHGHESFLTFSHSKSVLYKSSWLNFDLLKPPYGKKLSLIKKVYIVILILASASLSYSQTYTNPIWDANAPDPTVIHASDGKYYAYTTQGVGPDGNRCRLQVLSSSDMVHWEHLGDALPDPPSWARTTYNFWAPHVMEANGKYYMYYSAEPDPEVKTGKDLGLCLAVAVSDTPEGPFKDSGRPLVSGDSFINIDPMAFKDPVSGRHYLYWGSGFEPLKVRELSDDLMSFRKRSKVKELVYPFKKSYQFLVEGSWVIYKDGWYYLFFSGDNCCGEKAHYAVMVARSKSPEGPFEVLKDKEEGDRPILQAGGKWIAPGHNSVIEDADGALWIIYHAIDKDNRYTDLEHHAGDIRVMMMDRLLFKDGWPVIDGGIPSAAPTPAPVTR